jgi:hypothetical protein
MRLDAVGWKEVEMNCRNLLVLALGATIFTSVLVTGCSATAQAGLPLATPALTPAKAVNNPTLTPADTHDVRIISLHLEPAINNNGTVDTLENRTLLVAIDNNGNKAESNISVALAVKSDSDKESLISQTQNITTLAPGEVKVLKFGGLSTLPSRPAYKLIVDTVAVPGEVKTADNSKTLELIIKKP